MKCHVAARSYLLALTLAGCHLIDQRDFDAKAGRPPALPRLAPAAAPAPALVTIRYTTPNPDYRDPVSAAVKRALARKPDVLFTVVTVVPAQSTPDAEAEQAAAASASGRDVAQAIVDAGAAPGQVEQAVRIQPGISTREVRINVH